jgi:hypothetical protein
MYNLTKLLFIFCFYVVNTFSQNTIISAEKMNVLYTGIKNPLTIISELEFDSISLKNGTIKFDSSLKKYNVYLTNEGSATFTIFKNKKEVQSKFFRVKRLPTPEMKIANKFGPKELTKKELALIDNLTLAIQNFDLPIEFTLTEISIYGKKNGKAIGVELSGSVLSDSAKELLRNCDVGSKILIDARYKSPDGRVSGTSLGIKVK